MVDPKKQDKPSLHLAAGNTLSVEMLARMFENLTGRKPTAKELEDAERKLPKSK